MSYTGPYGGNLSPDGRTVVYVDSRHDPIDVHIVTQDGEDVIYSSFPGVYNTWFIGWAPDSRHFLLNLSKEDLRLEVPYLCAAREQPIKLTHTDDANAVVWSMRNACFLTGGARACTFSVWVRPASWWMLTPVPSLTIRLSIRDYRTKRTSIRFRTDRRGVWK